MPSEHRLHPLSIAFWLGGQIRKAVFPLVFGAASASFVGGLSIRTVILAGFIPLAIASVVRYLTFRYRFEAGELVIRTGLFFKRERHVPYQRIQNLDAVQGIFHRVLGVVEVKIQTGGGQEPEATMTVLPMDALESLRHRVFEGKDRPAESGSAAPHPPAIAETDAGDRLQAAPPIDVATGTVQGRTLLHLPSRELVLYGLIQNRGMLVLAAAFGVAWETGIVDRVSQWAVGEGSWAQSVTRGLADDMSAGGVAAGGLAVLAAVLVGVLVFARLLSMAWALVRLHDFRVVRADEDLRTTFGSLTQVAATIPLRRIQTVTIHEGPLHRWAGRVAVGVQTAGGHHSEDGDPHRQWLAPIIRRDRLPEFLGEIVPELDMAEVTWRPVAPAAFRRVLKESWVVASLVSIPIYVLLGAWGAAAHVGLLGWAALYARRYVQHLGWVVREGTVLFKSGWLWRRTSIARFAKIQVVTLRETPFDRRRAMARLKVDTAGAGAASHKVEIPYLPAATAREMGDLIATAAAQTAFRW